MVPVSTFATLSWNVAPQQLNRYQGYPAIRITGSAASGESSGTAMKAMEALARDACGYRRGMGREFIAGESV